MCRVSFLPEKFHRPDEKTGAHLPPHHVCPLVDEHWQVAIRLDPLAVHVADDSLRGRTDDERFFQLFAAAVCDNGEFRFEPFHMLRLFFDETHGDEKRERSVLVSGGFKP